MTGLSVAAPVGPNGALCIRRSLVAGRRAGFVTGLGAATAHAIFVALAITGLGVSEAALGRGELMRRIAGVVLLGLGMRTLRVGWTGGETSSLATEAASRRNYVSTLALALANPMTIASLSALLGGLGMPMRGLLTIGLVVSGVFAGSAAWWLALSSAVAALRTRITARHLLWVNRATAASLGAFGLWVLTSSV